MSAAPWRREDKRNYPPEVRIGACADYLIGRPVKEIEFKWGVPACTVAQWIKKTGSFKLRKGEFA